MSERTTRTTNGTGSATEQRAYGRSVNGATKKKAFLAHLAATGNVKQAAAAAGAGGSYFYNARRIDVAFAAEWKAAVAAAYDRLEEALLARALAKIGAGEGDTASVDAPTVTIELVDGRLRDAPVPADVAEDGAAEAPAAETTSPAGGTAEVTLVDVQFALTMLNRRAALERRGRERAKRRRPTADEVEVALNAKLDALARRLTPLGGSEG